MLTEEYAIGIARDWNTKDPNSGFMGYVLRFHVSTDYLDQFDVQLAGGRECREYWIPAEQLADFNAHIVGQIEVIHVFHGEQHASP